MVSNNAAAQLIPVLISSGLPPVPKKFVCRVQEGLFVEMAELLPHKAHLSRVFFWGPFYQPEATAL